VIIGGGFFGAYLALILRARGVRAVILERSSGLMLRASYNNQARVHKGYHYPRSMITAVRSRVNFPRFLEEFPACIVDGFEKYYAVSRVFSKVSANQFERFMMRTGMEFEPAPTPITKLFDPYLTERIWKVREVVFDALKLRNVMDSRLKGNGIAVISSCEVKKVSGNGAGTIRIDCNSGAENLTFETGFVFNCTYSGINRIRMASGLKIIPLKHELTELALIEPPADLKNISITMMCGPFFSLLPFPSQAKWTLSHVRLTPHLNWIEDSAENYHDAYDMMTRYSRTSQADLMIRDATRYLPVLRHCTCSESLWEVKTTLPQSEVDDSRPILVHKDGQLPGFISILGGKIDNVYDLEAELDEIL
jgi:glycine/D-amino acid oxidase-like deaminating enzyme